MLLKLNKISVIPLALIIAIFHSSVGLIIGVVITIGTLFNQESEGIWGLGAWALIVLPIINGALGFLTGLFISASYNLIAQSLDKGIELDFDQKDAVSLK